MNNENIFLIGVTLMGILTIGISSHLQLENECFTFYDGLGFGIALTASMIFFARFIDFLIYRHQLGRVINREEEQSKKGELDENESSNEVWQSKGLSNQILIYNELLSAV